MFFHNTAFFFFSEFHIVVCGLDSIVARRWINGMMVSLTVQVKGHSHLWTIKIIYIYIYKYTYIHTCMIKKYLTFDMGVIYRFRLVY